MRSCRSRRPSRTCASRAASGDGSSAPWPCSGTAPARSSATWFGRRFIERRLHVGQEVVVSGRLKRFRGALTVDNPEFQSVDAAGEVLMAGRIVPVYRLTAGLTAARLRVAEREALDRAGLRLSRVPPARGATRRCTCRPSRSPWRPPTTRPTSRPATQALDRLAFDELLALQLGMVGRRRARGRDAAPPVPLERGDRRRDPRGPARRAGTAGRTGGDPDRRPGRGHRPGPRRPRPRRPRCCACSRATSDRARRRSPRTPWPRPPEPGCRAPSSPRPTSSPASTWTRSARCWPTSASTSSCWPARSRRPSASAPWRPSPRVRRRSWSGRTRCSRRRSRSPGWASRSSTSSIASASSSAASSRPRPAASPRTSC